MNEQSAANRANIGVAALRKSPSSVTAVCSLAGSDPVGMIASTMVPVSLNPPIVSICIQSTSRASPTLRVADRLGLGVRGESNEEAAISLAIKAGDRFENLDYSKAKSGAIHIVGSSLRMETSVRSEVLAGDHLIVLLDLHSLDDSETAPPLVFHQSRMASLRHWPGHPELRFFC